MRLFRTDAANIDSINATNFNRSFDGVNGKGICIIWDKSDSKCVCATSLN